MSDMLKSLAFAAVLCVVCSLLLTGAASGLKPLQVRNANLDKQKNILKAVNLITPGADLSAADIQRIYHTHIQALWVNADGDMIDKPEQGARALPIYISRIDRQINAYIIPIDTPGLWGKIMGYLALENDGATIAGFSVFKSQETPGLGGEIESAWFQKNFVGKKIVSQDGDFVSIAIAKGKISNDQIPADRRANYVDGISGATITGQKLTAGLKSILSEYEPVSLKFRHDKINMQANPS